jgi:hypothetical protein
MKFFKPYKLLFSILLISLPGINTSAASPTNIILSVDTLDENLPDSVFVAKLTTVDLDIGSTFIYTLVSGSASADNDSFYISNDTLYAKVVFDHEWDDTKNIRIRTNDGTNIFEKAFIININDVNEAPRITSNGGGASAAVSRAENTTAVTTVTATDVDASTTFTYSIAGGADQSLFSIGSSSGALVFNPAPNFEVPTDAGGDNIYNVQVRVTDNGTPSLTDVQDIAITVTNVNELPVITSNGGGDNATINRPENNTTVTTVTATDPDVPSTLTYSITSGTDQSDFTLESTTGVLTFITSPNFESPHDANTNNTYNFTVTVSDGTLSDAQVIQVIVQNVNEAPVITSDGGGSTTSVNVLENTTAVTTVTATDVDASTTLTYSITNGADAAKFSINGSSGALVFVTAPIFESPTDAGLDNVYDVQTMALVT